MANKFEAVVFCRASALQVYEFLAAGAGTDMKVKGADPKALTVTLKSKMGLMSYGEIVDCSVVSTQNGCRVTLKGRPVLVTNITADVKGTVMKVSDALGARFGY